MKTAQTIAAQQAQEQGAESLGTAKRKRKMHPNSLAAIKPYEFQPGQSGNPEGRPKDTAADIARRIFENNPEQVYQALAGKMLQGDAYAFSVLADRGYGKVKQTSSLEVTGKDGGPAEIIVRLVKPQ